MSRSYIIYKADFGGNKCYIGITSQKFCQRQNRHLSDTKRGSKVKFHKAIKKYNYSINWQIIDTCNSKDTAMKLEKLYISKFDSYKNGYNSTLGGELPWNLGKKVGNFRKGIKLSEETRLNIAKRGGSKLFFVYDRYGNLLGSWINKSKCSRDLKINKSTIIRGLNKKKVTNKQKFWFSYHKIKNIPTFFKYIEVEKNNAPFFSGFDVVEISKILDIKETKIRDCLSGKRLSHKGFTFKSY